MIPHHSPSSRQSGFSLVEMAVVLTIIALLVGSILTGKNMIRSSEVQATAAKVQEYKGAVNKFQERYLELPGDMKAASSYWSGAYNGNGDGHIGGSLDGSCGGDFTEQWAAFQHMGKAELVDGQFVTTGGSMPSPGVNTPKTPVNGGGYTLRFCGDITSSAWYYVGYYGHVIQVGLPVAGGTRGPIFTPDEAAAIDTKFDDSFPASGSVKAPLSTDSETVQTIGSGSEGCTTTNNPTTADYNFEQGTRLCPMFFLMGF